MACKTLLLITVAALVTLLTIFSFSSSDRLPVSSLSLHATGQGKLGNIPRTFTKHLEYFDLSPAGDANWSAILPPNGGFVSQKHGKEYRMAGVTMFHQLHCLQLIRRAIQDLQKDSKRHRRHLDHEGMLNADDDPVEPHHIPGDHIAGEADTTADAQLMGDEADDDDLVPHGEHDSMHWVHCLDYLMQGILCAADDTIEAAEDDEGRVKVDGYGITHMCRSPNQVWAMVRGKGDKSPY